MKSTPWYWPCEDEGDHPERLLPARSRDHLCAERQHVVGQRHIECEREGRATWCRQGEVPDYPRWREVWGEPGDTQKDNSFREEGGGAETDRLKRGRRNNNSFWVIPHADIYRNTYKKTDRFTYATVISAEVLWLRLKGRHCSTSKPNPWHLYPFMFIDMTVRGSSPTFSTLKLFLMAKSGLLLRWPVRRMQQLLIFCAHVRFPLWFHSSYEIIPVYLYFPD